MAKNPSQLYLHGCDLYLLEKWDTESAVPDDEQMMQIFEHFVKLPIAERYAYTQQLKDRALVTAASLSQDDQDILGRARPYEERRSFEKEIVLRTYYGPGSDVAFESIMQDPMLQYNTELLSNASRYDFDSDWQRIFHRIPQLLDVWPGYEADVEEARQLGIRLERQDRAVLESEGYRWPEDAAYVGDFYRQYHFAKKVGFICVLDELTLGDRWQEVDQLTNTEEEPAQEKGKEADRDSKMLRGGLGQCFLPPLPQRGPYWEERCGQRKLLAGWFDADGQMVRWNYLPAGEVALELGCISLGTFEDHAIWAKAALDFEALPDPNFEGNPVTEKDLEDDAEDD